MRVHGLVLLASGLLVQTVPADDTSAARTIVDEAIRAHGGEDAMAKYSAVTATYEGIFHGHDRIPAFLFTSESTTHGADQGRDVIQGKMFDQQFLIIHVVDGRRGWIRMAGSAGQETREYNPGELAARREGVYRTWICSLLPLRGKDFTLALAGAAKVQDRPAVGVRVSCHGHRDVTLYFDKETRLLVKIAARMREAETEVTVETVMRLHKAVQGVKRPMMLMVYRDGHHLHSWWVKEYQLAEKPAAGLFIKP